jgi:hypothetical protein
MVQGLQDPDNLTRDEAFALDADALLALTQQPDGLDLILDAFDERDAPLDAERFEFGDGVSVEVYDLTASGQSIFNHDQDAAGRRTIHNLTESGSGDSFNTAHQKELREEEEKRKKSAEENAIASYLLRMQLAEQMAWLRDQIDDLKGRIEEYNRRLAEMGVRIEDLTEALDLNEENQSLLVGLPADMTLTEMYQQHFAGKILSGDPDSLINSMKTPLTVDGHIVYSDGNGYYRLKLDEQGNEILNEQGMPEREYYQDFAPEKVPEIMHRVINNHELLGQYSVAGRDPMNMRWQELLEIKDLPQNICDHIEHAAPPLPDNASEPCGSMQTVGDMLVICDEVTQTCTPILEETIEQQRKTTHERDQAQEELEEKQEQLEEVQDEAREAGMSEGEIAAASESLASAESFESGTPAPQYDTGKLPEAIANQIEGGKLDAESLTFAMADLTEEQKAALLRNIESQGVQIVVTNAAAIDPALTPYIKDEQKPQIFGGPGVFAHIDDPSENLPVVAAKGTSFARSLDEEVQPSSMRSGFASAVKGPQAAPELTPAAPAPAQTLNNDMLA